MKLLSYLDACFAGHIIEGACTVLAVAIGAFATYKYALKQARKENRISIERERYNRTLNALQASWALLVYTTTTENEQAILTFTRNSQTRKDTWFLNRVNAQAYLQALPQYFYTHANGLYLDSGIKKLLFEYRNIVYGFLLKEKENQENLIPIQNNEMVNRMKKIHDEFVILLQKAMDEVF